MKDYTAEEYKIAKKIAYSHTFATSSLYCGNRMRLDNRTRIARLVVMFERKIRLTFEKKQEILSLKKQRAISKISNETSIFENKLVKDYFQNKSSIKQINDDRIIFYGRNHWAKDDKDRKIFSIFQRTQYKFTIN